MLAPFVLLWTWICLLSISDARGPLSKTGVPTIVGLGIGLSILSLLLCLMFRLFSRSRWSRSRGYADANIPPTIILEGTDQDGIDIEKQLYKPNTTNNQQEPGRSDSKSSIKISHSRSPSQGSRRRGSGNNNSNYSRSSNGSINVRKTSIRSSSEPLATAELCKNSFHIFLEHSLCPKIRLG